MLGLCFCYLHSGWELRQWDYLVASFQVDDIWVIGPKDTPIRESGILKRSTLIQSAEELPTNVDIVVGAPKKGRFIQGRVPLTSFRHPTAAIYLFGLDNVHLSESQLGERKPDHTVYITVSSRWELYAHVAAAIFLYDRKFKEVKNG